MADNTKIEWADATVNAINGCTVHSPGCANCYAMRMAGTRLRQHPTRAGLTQPGKAGPVWNGEVRLNEFQLLDPLHWRKPRRIFWNAHGDTFHENVPDEWIDRCFAVMALTPQHQHLVLTKRSARMREYLSHPRIDGRIDDPWVQAAFDIKLAWPKHGAVSARRPLPNVWLGVSVEDQTRADERIPDLLATPAAVRWISAEPLLSGISLAHIAHPTMAGTFIDALDGNIWHPDGGIVAGQFAAGKALGWVVAGGESGPGARGSTDEVEANMRSLRDQCRSAGVAFFAKQNYRKLPLPDDLLVQEYPA